MPVANGSEEMEAVITIDVLRRCARLSSSASTSGFVLRQQFCCVGLLQRTLLSPEAVRVRHEPLSAALPRRAGADVTVASVEDQLQVECSRGVKLVADRLLPECRAETYDLIALPVRACVRMGGHAHLRGARGRGAQT